MEQDFFGKVVLVTGSSGIGLGAALRMARGGAKVFLCGIAKEHNQTAVAAAAGLDVTVARVDVANEASVRDWIAPIGAGEGHIDVLVNAAAIQTYGTISSTDTEHWDKVIAVNLRSCFLTSHHAYPFMIGGGAIVHVSSVQGQGYNERRDIAVLGFDDITFASVFSPPLTTIKQNRLEIGRHAASMLLGLI